MHQLALAIVQHVLTEEVSCYKQNNDSSHHVSEIFYDILEIPGAMLDSLAIKEWVCITKCRSRNLIPAIMRYKREILDIGGSVS